MKKFLGFFGFFAALVLFTSFGVHAEDTDSKHLSQQAMSEGPHFDDDSVKGWASNASNSVFDFSHENYEQRFEGIKDFFTTAGFRSFYGAMNDSGFIKSFVDKKQTLRGYIVSPVLISEPKIVRSTFFWTASFNYVIEYKSGERILYQFLKVSVDIKEINSDEETKTKALAIDRWQSFVDEDPVFCACKDSSDSKPAGSLHDQLQKAVGAEETDESEETEKNEEIEEKAEPKIEGKKGGKTKGKNQQVRPTEQVRPAEAGEKRAPPEESVE